MIIKDSEDFEITVEDFVSCQGDDGLVVEGSVVEITRDGKIKVKDFESKEISEWEPSKITVQLTNSKE